MKKTLQQIREAARGLISQTAASNSDFTDAELNGFANRGVQFIATLVEWPRDIIAIQVEEGKPAYPLITDAMKLRTGYFGDQNTAGDVIPIQICTEEQLREYAPNWLDKTSSARGRPTKVILLDRVTVLVHPTPNAEEAASGKKLFLGYVYYPAALSADGDYPDLPDVYHDFIEEYAAHLCYLGKLEKANKAKEILDLVTQKVKAVQPQATDDIQDKFWGWGNYESESSSDNISSLRL